MRNLLFLYVGFHIFFTNFVSANDHQCGLIGLKEGSETINMYFEIPRQNQQVKLLFKISDSEKTEIQDLFYCISKEKNFNCTGDDDGGSFTLYSEEQAISIIRIGSGNPDQKRIEIKPIPKTPFKLSDCKTLRSSIKE